MPDTETYEHYEVLRRPTGELWELGRGAMGVTYKALDKDLHCHVALKIIAPGLLDDEDALQRFMREARSAAQLRHQNIATVFRLGKDAEGTHFYTMEFCEGKTLQETVEQQGALSTELALEIALQVTRALVVAEQHQVVHRDLKPANLILTEGMGEGVVVKIIDFGLAKRTSGGDGWASMAHGGFIGTAHFASPEQIEAGAGDTRSDIY